MLSTERMRDIKVDPVTRVAIVPARALNAEVKTAAAEHGLWYPPDPSSFEICSIGGNAATNAGGLCCVKYGVTTDYVLGLQVVLADGTAVRLGGPRLKDVAGLSLTKLFVGSEGTLGVITELTLRLLPTPPPSSTLVAAFASIDAAAERCSRSPPSCAPQCSSSWTRSAINAVEDKLRMGLDRGAGALLLGARTRPARPAPRCRHSWPSCSPTRCDRGVFDRRSRRGRGIRAARRAAIPAVEEMGPLLLEDVGVPLPRCPHSSVASRRSPPNAT